ncbi:MAG: hypothetical protein KF768_09640 [Phycisphaeraceae bacterium]|nr:hypothetical protein [Phycisphaeraceae bacterium]
MPDLNENREGPSVITATIITTPEAASQNCVVVERPRRMGSVEQMWIDSSSYLIRRVVEPRHTLGLPPPDAIEVLKAAHPEHAETVARAFAQLAKQEPVEVESITTYQGAFDVDVTMEELRFIPSVE